MGQFIANMSQDTGMFKYIKPFFVGGSAGCMATCCVQPIDMVKVRIQMGTASTNPVVVAKDIIAAEGVGGLYKGLSAGILRQLTYGMSQRGDHGWLLRWSPTNYYQRPRDERGHVHDF